MRQKHPAATYTDRRSRPALRPVDPSAALQLDEEAIAKSIRSFPKGSAGGLSGLRPQHLQDALTTGSGHEFLRQLTALCNFLLRGGTPDDVGAWLLGAKLAALRKPDSTLRPIAVGEVLRRLVGKAAAAEVTPDLRA